MRLHRFYVNDSVKQQPLGEEIVVDDVSTIKQWSKVFRYKQGDSVILFDGHQKDCTYEIDSISTKEAKLHLVSLKETFPLPKNITLYLSLIKKDNFELAVQKCTELGVSTIIPVLTERSEKKSLNMERLRNIAIEASEQCGRGDVPVISEITTLEEAFSSKDAEALHIVAAMGGVSCSSAEGERLLNSKALTIWIGPEGGWGEGDKAIFAQGGTTSMSFGSTVLRAETAAIVGVGFLLL